MGARRPLSGDRSLTQVANLAAWVSYFFLIMPSLIIIPMSFSDKDELMFPPAGISLYLYEKYLYDPDWIDVTIQSFRVAVGATALSLLLGVSAAYGISRGRFPGKRAITILLLSPIFIPAIVVALGLYLYLGRAHLTGTTVGLIAGHSVVTIPFVIVTALAGLRHVDRNLEIAAMVMGASRLQVVRKITLPLLRPTIVAGGLFAFLISFDEVVISYFISHVQRQTLPVKMYSSITWDISPVLAAVSTLLTVMSLMVCVGVAMVQKETR